MKNLVKKMFTKENLAAIAAAIGDAEKTTEGEIRVSIRQKRRWRERKLSIEEMARKEFHTLGMVKTKDRIGILIFLLLQDKQFYLLADEGIHRKVEEGTWKTIAEEMSHHFSKQDFERGIVHGVLEVGIILSKHFPAKKGDKNELPNEVHLQ